MVPFSRHGHSQRDVAVLTSKRLVRQVGEVEEYLQRGPSFVFLFHPALGAAVGGRRPEAARRAPGARRGGGAGGRRGSGGAAGQFAEVQWTMHCIGPFACLEVKCAQQCADEAHPWCKTVQVVDLDCDGSLLVHADATLGSLADPAAQQQPPPLRSMQSIEVLPLNGHHTANRSL